MGRESSEPAQRGRARAAAIDHAGRALAILAPVAAAEALTGRRGPAAEALATVVLAAVWYASIEAGFVASRTTLATLGPRLPALRGSLLGLVVTTALGAWVDPLALPVPAGFALAGAIFLGVGSWDTFFLGSVAPPLRLLIVGPVEVCTGVVRELGTRDGRRFRLVGIVDDRGAAAGRDGLVVGTTAELPAVIARLQPDLVALAPGCDRPATFTKLADAASAGFRVLELAQFYEYAFGCVPVRDLPRSWFMSVLHLYQRPYARLTKRASDLVGALAVLVLAAPLFPILVLLVRCTRGPLLIRQVRVGEHGRLFTMYKFRTMRADAEAPGEAVWAQANDPRVTAAGRVMRRLRLDELPQLWNVIKGEMSIVGPRPERPEFIDELFEKVPHWGRRHLVKPGITGWAQVKRGYTADAEGSLEKLSYDLWYIRHRSLTVDLVICARTLAAVFRVAPVVPPRPAGELDPLHLLPHHQAAGGRSERLAAEG